MGVAAFKGKDTDGCQFRIPVKQTNSSVSLFPPPLQIKEMIFCLLYWKPGKEMDANTEGSDG